MKKSSESELEIIAGGQKLKTSTHTISEPGSETIIGIHGLYCAETPKITGS